MLRSMLITLSVVSGSKLDLVEIHFLKLLEEKNYGKRQECHEKSILFWGCNSKTNNHREFKFSSNICINIFYTLNNFQSMHICTTYWYLKCSTYLSFFDLYW